MTCVEPLVVSQKTLSMRASQRWECRHKSSPERLLMTTVLLEADVEKKEPVRKILLSEKKHVKEKYRAAVYEILRTKDSDSVVNVESLRAQTLEIWLVRHGETEANSLRMTQGQQHGRLTSNGAVQAKKLGDRLKREHPTFDCVMCSDLLRCRQTATLATRDWLETQPFILDPLLRERSVGVYEGSPHAGGPRPKRPAGVKPRAFRAPSGESWFDVYDRAHLFLQRLTTTFVDDTSRKQKLKVLVVSHGGFISETINAANNTKDNDDPFHKKLAVNGAFNTAIYKLQASSSCRGEEKQQQPSIWKVLSSNDASHLLSFEPRKTMSPPHNFDLANDHPSLPSNATTQRWWTTAEQQQQQQHS